VANVEIIAKRH